MINAWFLCSSQLRSIRLPVCCLQAVVGGGAEEARTPDPLLAKEVLSQLSYGPVLVGRPWCLVVGEWWGILDSNQRPQSYQDCALTS